MSFLPENSSDKQRKQREYKAALDFQVGLKERLTGAAAPANNLPVIAQPQQNRAVNSNNNPRFPQSFQFASENDYRPPPPRPVPMPINRGVNQATEDPRGLMNQVDKLAWNLRSSDEQLQSLHDTMLTQDQRLRQEVANVGDAFLRFSQDTDKRVDQLSVSLQAETERSLKNARSSMQSFSAVNEELEGLIGRQETISERLTHLSRSDNDLQTRLEDTKQYFLKELEDFRRSLSYLTFLTSSFCYLLSYPYFSISYLTCTFLFTVLFSGLSVTQVERGTTGNNSGR